MTERNKNQKLPQNTNAALQEVMNAILGLQKIYEFENEALMAADTKKFLEIQDDKLQAATTYQSYMAQILGRKDELANLDPHIKEKFKSIQKEFSELSDRNLVAIQRMQRCTEMVGETLRNAAIRSVKSQRGFNYAENGSFVDNKKRGLSSGLSETA
ncbi:MAG: hypothetical protein OEY94_02675 [Alphaproteobacteria bacterium]|nr:hypothetical protein [Alphaproteobacteria bacterium]